MALGSGNRGSGWCRHTGGGKQEESREKGHGEGSGGPGGLEGGPGGLEQGSDGNGLCVLENVLSGRRRRELRGGGGRLLRGGG